MMQRPPNALAHAGVENVRLPGSSLDLQETLGARSDIALDVHHRSPYLRNIVVEQVE